MTFNRKSLSAVTGESEKNNFLVAIVIILFGKIFVIDVVAKLFKVSKCS